MYGPDTSKLKLNSWTQTAGGFCAGRHSWETAPKSCMKNGTFSQDKLEFCSLFKEDNNLWKINSHIFDSFHILNSLQQLRCLGKQPRRGVLAKFSLLSFKILGFPYMGCNTWNSMLFQLKKWLFHSLYLSWSFNLLTSYWASSFICKVQLTTAGSSG